jgi:hypothetical protein
MGSLEIPAIIVPYSVCRNCLSEHSIELYDINGRPMNYQLMLRMNNFSSIDKAANYISYFKCNKCRMKYLILWENGIPIPLQTNTRINNFIIKFTKEED